MPIRISPDEVRTKAGEFATEAAAVQDVITKMDSLLGALQGGWEGAASTAFANSYLELKPGFTAARDLIEGFSKKLNSAANVMEQTDADLASLL